MKASSVTDPILENISQLGLERKALELDVCGYTVVEEAIDPDLTARGLEAALDTFHQRTGNRPNVDTGKDFEGYSVSRFMLLKDRAFEEILMAEKVLALVDYLVGQDCVLSTFTAHMRGQGGGKTLPTGYLPLHHDDVSPQPQATFYNNATVNICLTDVSEESGCLAFVPGSHKRLRQPTDAERVLAGDGANPEAVPMVAPAGSAIIWPAHTWHGSWVSNTPGLRVTIAELFARPHMHTYDMYRESISDEVLDRNSERFATLMSMKVNDGWNDNQDDWYKNWGDRDRTRYRPPTGSN